MADDIGGTVLAWLLGVPAVALTLLTVYAWRRTPTTTNEVSGQWLASHGYQSGKRGYEL